MFVENPLELLKCTGSDNDSVCSFLHHLQCVLPESCSIQLGYPQALSVPQMLVPLLLGLGNCWYAISTVFQSSDNSYFTLQWVLRIKELVLVCVSGFLV